MPALPAWAFGSLLLSLRIGPAFAFAPPFSLTRFPRLFRILLALALASTLVSHRPDILAGLELSPGALVGASASELMLGLTIVTLLQLAFGAIYVAGRTVDIQGGFGFSLLIDPTSRASTPLIGTLFALLAGMLFFAADGAAELLRIISASLDSVPLGRAALPATIAPLMEFLGIAYVAAMGAAGGLILTLFLADLAIAMLSRTVPQMNVLVLGFQVKTLALLIALPVTLGLSAALLARLMRITLTALPGML